MGKWKCLLEKGSISKLGHFGWANQHVKLSNGLAKRKFLIIGNVINVIKSNFSLLLYSPTPVKLNLNSPVDCDFLCRIIEI